MTPEEVIITIEDCRVAGFCVRGCIPYLDSIGLSYKALRDGEYTAAHFLAMGDANATIVANNAIKRGTGQ